MYLELVRMHTHAHTNLEECCNRGTIILSFAVLELLKCRVLSFLSLSPLVLSPDPHFLYTLCGVKMYLHVVTSRVCNSKSVQLPFVYTTATWAVWCRQSVLNMLIRYLTWYSSKHIHCWLVIPIGLLGEVTYIYTSSQITSWQIFRMTWLSTITAEWTAPHPIFLVEVPRLFSNEAVQKNNLLWPRTLSLHQLALDNDVLHCLT